MTYFNYFKSLINSSVNLFKRQENFVSICFHSLLYFFFTFYFIWSLLSFWKPWLYISITFYKFPLLIGFITSRSITFKPILGSNIPIFGFIFTLGLNLLLQHTIIFFNNWSRFISIKSETKYSWLLIKARNPDLYYSNSYME